MISNLRDILDTANSDLLRVVESTGLSPHKKGADDWVSCCPFHDEKTPSFHVHPVKGFFKCFGCDAKGDAVTFLRKKFPSYTYPDVVEYIAKTFGKTIEYNGVGDLEKWKAIERKNRDEKTALYNAALECSKVFQTKLLAKSGETIEFAGRTFKRSTAEQFAFGAYDSPPVKVDIAKRIGATMMLKRHIFSIHDVQGRVVGFSGRVIGKVPPGEAKYMNSPSAKEGEVGIYDKGKILYGLFQNAKAIQRDDHACLVEGATDVATLFEQNVAAVASCGTAFTFDQAKLLSSYCRRLTILMDGDAAGIKAAKKAIFSEDNKISIVLRQFDEVNVCLLPPDHDPDSFCRENPEAFKKYLDEKSTDAVLWYILDGVKTNTVGGRKTAIDRAKSLFKFLPTESRHLYTKELESRLNIAELWRLLKDEIDEVSTESIIKQAKDLAGAEALIKFPLDAFHPTMQEMMIDFQRDMRVPLEYIAGSMLCVSGTAIGNKYVSTFKGRIHSAVLYSVLVGPSGDGKTPAHNRALEPIWKIDAENKAVWQVAVENWQNECRFARERKDPEPPKPKRTELIIKDSTTEKIIQILDSNGMGCISWQNEFKTFLSNLSRYSGGNALGFWLDMYDTLRYKRQRTSEDTTDLEFPFCSLLTGIQPGILKDLAENDAIDSGFFARLSFFYPQGVLKHSPGADDDEPDPNTIALYEAMIKRLYKMQSKVFEPKDGVNYWSVTRMGIPLNEESRDIYRKWLDENTKRYNAEDDDRLKSLYSKAESLVMRLALILHLQSLTLHYGDEILKETPEGIAHIGIHPEAMNGAIKLAEYFRQTSELVLSRFESPVNGLPELQRNWYQALPVEFKTTTAKESASQLGFSVRTVARLLGDKMLFIPMLTGGYYRKRYEA